MNSGNAQSVIGVAPTFTDQYLSSSPPTIPPYSSTISRMNCAVIDYIPATGGSQQLFAVSEYGNYNPGCVHFRDRTTLCAADINYSLFAPLVDPDIIIGNSTTFPATDYIVAVAYLAIGIAYIDYYNVHFTSPGSGVFGAPALIGTSAIPGAASIHLDIIGQETNTGATGLPFCDNFVVTWADATGIVFVDYASINIPPVFFPTPSAYVLGPGSGQAPDVAGVQRYPGGIIGGPIDDYALVTYVDFTGTNLYYFEYDFTAATVSATTNLQDNISIPGLTNIAKPRIDAPDWASLSAPWAPGVSQYKVAAQITGAMASIYLYTYDNTTFAPGGPGFPSAAWAGMGGIPLSPCVAVSDPGYDYSVQHISKTPPFFGHVWMEPVIFNDAFNFDPGAGFTQYYYQIDNPIVANLIDWDGANAISNSPNVFDRNAGGLLSVWAFNDPAANCFDAYYKFSVATGLHNFNYRKGNSRSTANGIENAPWQLYPNPAKAYLMVNNGTGDNKATGYIICDMTGRQVLAGTTSDTNPVTQIKISNLATGSYVISLYKDNTKIGSELVDKIAE